MGSIKNYCYSLIVISVTVTVIMLLSPENTRIIKYVRWITSLCIILILTAPISKLGADIEFNDYTQGQVNSVKENAQELIIEEFKIKISDTVFKLINERFKIESSNIIVNLNTDDVENIYINNIGLSLNTKSKFLKSDVEGFLKEKFLCEINIYD
ncbi:MAG: hypothetical protein IJC50_07630 [Clostridia bacterium]|nr:hypothetical protein [Clostridia bacterium]